MNPQPACVSSTLPDEKEKKIGLKAVIVLCLIFMVGFGGLFQHSPSLQPLSNENHTIGVGSSPPIKTKDTRTFQRLPTEEHPSDGQKNVLEARGRHALAGPVLRALNNLL